MVRFQSIRDQHLKSAQYAEFIDSATGARALRIHLGRVLEMAESSSDKGEYERKVYERFGLEQQLDLPIPAPTLPPQPAAN